MAVYKEKAYEVYAVYVTLHEISGIEYINKNQKQ